MNQKRIAPTRWILFLLVAYTPLLQAQAVNARTFNEDGASSATSLLSSGTATRSDLQVTGTYPEDAGQGSAAAWLEGGAVKAITFSSDGATITKSAVAELSSGTASDLQLTGDYPEDVTNSGAAAIWLEGGAVKAITFSSDGATITKSAVAELSAGTASDLQLTGGYPERNDNGAAAIWLEDGAVKAITFSSDGATITKSAVEEFSAGTASDLQLTGGFPIAAGNGAAAIWLEGGAVKAI